MPEPTYRRALGIDFGGTSVKLAVVGEDGRIEGRASFPTGSAPGAQAWLCAVERCLPELSLAGASLAEQIRGIGIGVPGLVDFEDGTVHYMANVPGWDQVPLARLTRARLGVPTRADNDVNAMALGETTFGAGRHYRHAVFVTLGTGVGGGLLINGQLYRGAHSMAGEIGHVSIDLDGVPSPEGRGCLEQYVGNRRLVERVSAQLADGRGSILPRMVAGDLASLTVRHIADAASGGDELSRELFEFAADCLACAFASATYLIQPEVFIVGGGVASAGELLFAPLRRRLAARLHPEFAGRVEVKPAQLGTDAGVIGAAVLAFQTSKPPEPATAS